MTTAFALSNIIMVYLLGVITVAALFGRGPSILASVLGVAAFDFFFVPPQWTFAVADTQYLVTFAVMLLTGLVISTLTAHVKFQAESARKREQRTAALYAMSRDLVEATTPSELVDLATKHISEVFDSEVFLFFPDPHRRGPVTIAPVPSRLAAATLDEHDLGVAQWVFDNGERAGRGTDTLPSASSLFVPLQTRGAIVGILGVRPRRTDQVTLFSSDQLRLLETFAGQVALAEERIRSAQDAQKAKLQAEAEQLRSSLLSAVSHDLRTPLAAIAGASSTLVDGEGLDSETRHELAESIFEESERLNRLVANLLDMTRLEAGALQLRKRMASYRGRRGRRVESSGSSIGKLQGRHAHSTRPAAFAFRSLAHPASLDEPAGKRHEMYAPRRRDHAFCGDRRWRGPRRRGRSWPGACAGRGGARFRQVLSLAALAEQLGRGPGADDLSRYCRASWR